MRAEVKSTSGSLLQTAAGRQTAGPEFEAQINVG
jgi:hypothetical protein